MIPKTWNLLASSSAEQPADDSEDSSAPQPAGDLTMVSNSLCLFARLPLEIWRWLVGLLSYSDVAACRGSRGFLTIMCEEFQRLISYGTTTVQYGLF